MSESNEREVFREFLKKKNYRLTKGRFRVLDAVLEEQDHFDADSLFLKLRGMDAGASRATVYRTLDLLVDAGFLSKMLTENQAYYEVIHGRGHHDHLICTSCGEIIEVYSRELEAIQDKICKKKGFVQKTHTLRIEGTCRNCR